MTEFSPKFPWLLYAYPWTPYPRRVIIYLREKNIPESLVTIVRVSTHHGDEADSGYPPTPPGTLPILMIPPKSTDHETIYIRQSTAIMNYLDELCDSGDLGFPKSIYPLRGDTNLERARVTELLSLAEELTIRWNSVRLFGNASGPISRPDAAKESLLWVQKTLATVESYLAKRDVANLGKGKGGQINMADIVLYQFFEFTKDCQGKDLTTASRSTIQKGSSKGTGEEFPQLSAFFHAFATRDSAARNTELGEIPNESTKAIMTSWADGVWD